MTTVCLLITLLTFFISGCNFRAVETAPLTPTTVRVTIDHGSPVPTLNVPASRVLQSVPTPTPLIEIPPTNTPDGACPGSGADIRSEHTVAAEIDYAAKVVNVRHQVRWTNHSGDAVDTFVLNLEPNRFSGVVTVNEVNVEALTGEEIIQATAYELGGRRLTVELSAPLAIGCALQAELVYRLAVPPVGTGLNALNGYFGYTVRQMNLGHWLATVAVNRSGEWISHDAVQIGEQIVAESANWDVTLTVINAPSDMTIAAPGQLDRPENAVWHYQLDGSREFAASLSDEFNVTLQDAPDGTMVELYSFREAASGGTTGAVDGAGHALLVAVNSLGMYSDLFGAFPYPRFVVVEGDFADGMEFSGMVFVGRDWFRGFTGEPGGYLTIITVHEVAHQWWYARVGNDQAVTPWLDEALATYSEYVFFEEFYPDLRDWWWEFRVNSFVRSQSDYIAASVDSPVYTFSTVRQYINAVYLRGARMLHALREDLGTDPFFDWLRRYSEAGANRVVTPDIFWSLLSPEQLEQTRDTRVEFLTDSDY